MSLIHGLLNILLPPLTLALLLAFLPLFYLIKLFFHVTTSLRSQNVAGKVVLVTGAASGIGKQVAYEYARKGSYLVLVDIRAEGLDVVAQECKEMGSPDVITVGADVSKIQDCKSFVEQAIHHFGTLDHLVNCAGIAKIGLLGSGNISDFNSVLDVNFWGTVYPTHFAIPHLRKNKGKVVVIASVLGRYPIPHSGFYNASKAALISLYDTLRAEVGSDIGVTIVTPGLISTDMTQGHFEKEALNFIPGQSARGCAEAIVRSACRGDRYLTEPNWMRVLYMIKVLCPPELIDWSNHLLFVTRLRRRKAARARNNKIPVDAVLKAE